MHELDNEALAFRPILGSMLGRIYHNPQNKEENQSRLEKILEFWGSKEVYDPDTISSLRREMKSGPAIDAANSLQHTGTLSLSLFLTDERSINVTFGKASTSFMALQE